MRFKTKAIYLNVGILVGLLLELYWGRPLYLVLISAVLLFSVANVLLFVVPKKVPKE
jgi:hypothetical protein